MNILSNCKPRVKTIAGSRYSRMREKLKDRAFMFIIVPPHFGACQSGLTQLMRSSDNPNPSHDRLPGDPLSKILS
jgi:hypothetical protein